MSKIRKIQTPFTQISNEMLNRKDLSLTAKGLFAYMFSKPDGWNFTINSMAKQLKEGTTAIGNALKDLKELGYIEYVKFSDGTGEYVLRHEPDLKNDDLNPEDQNLEMPNFENAYLAKPNRISNKDSIETKIDSNKDCSSVANAPAPSTHIFNAYADAMRMAYNNLNIDPARGAKINKLLNNMIERVGFDGAMLVASNYPFHKNQYYVQRTHAVEFMVKDCEQILVQVQANQMITRTQALQADKQGAFDNRVQQMTNDPLGQETF
jgi:hypothetical protein